jgi:3-oxoacyl-[acyl-carrier protein] reductase
LMLQDKVCFITGSTRGIGWATAREFARHGATVILNNRGPSGLLEERCQELEDEFHRTVVGLAADVTDASAVKGCYGEIFRRFKRLDVLVNNAGILHDGLLGMISEETMRRVIDTNLLGSLVNLQEASRLMARNRCGSIINVSSIVGRFGDVGLCVYAASKSAVIGMAMAAAKELAPSNIRVNIVAPGFVDTALAQQLSPEKYERRIASIKMGRIGTAEEVARVIVFLGSDMSSYVTGQVIGVDGGMII